MRTISVEERRARLARRHHLAGEARSASAEEVAANLVGLHATDPSTIYLAARARIDGFEVCELEAGLYEHDTLVKHLGMRRTMFVLPSDLIPVVQAACTDAVARRIRTRLVNELEQAGVARDGGRWLANAEQETLAALAELGEASGQELGKAVPTLRAKFTFGEGKAWGGEVGVATRVLTLLSAEGKIIRGRPRGAWTSSQHRWRLWDAGTRPELPEQEARVELVRRWLASFGPATDGDVSWWTGLGLTRIREALRVLGVVEVDLDGEIGVVLPDDLDPEPDVDPWVALLPALDPTTMGWKRRDWYLGVHARSLFDGNGNAGPTVWVSGRVVGGWAQQADGSVVYQLLEDVGSDAIAAIEREATALSDWLGGTVVTSRFPTPLERELRARAHA